MIRVNGKKMPLYELDTNETIRVRIAAELETLPKYLYGIPDKLEKKNKVEDLLLLIKTHANTSTDFEEFMEQNKEKFQSLDIKKDVLEVWIAYNSQYEELVNKMSTLVLESFAEPLVLKGYFVDADEFVSFWENGRELVIKTLSNKIKNNSVENKKNIDLYEIFQNIQDGRVYTPLKTERIAINMTLDIQNTTILELFNYIQLNETVPFASCKNYYKILKDFIPPEDWPKNNTDHIILKVFEKATLDPSKYKDYTDVEISINENNETILNMRLTTERGYLSKEAMIKRVFKVFERLGMFGYTNMKETEVLGIFYFPQDRINTYVFSDLVMNNTLFSNLINIDESNKATKKKTDSAQPWLYIHYNHPSTGHITAAITQRIVDRSDIIMREEDPDIFPHGEPYIRVRVKGRDKESIEKFQRMFSKLLVVYTENHNDIVEIYEQYIPDFGTIREVTIPELKQSDLLPEIFVSNFSRYCSESRYPTVVDDEKAEEYKNEGKEIMTFPRERPDSAPFYPSDGKNIQNYVCLNPEYPYPGLQVNIKLSNSKEYPFIPCCFKNEQSNKKGGVYRHYYFNEEVEAKGKKQQDLITTDKILGMDKYGMLPESIQKLFETLDPEANYKYIRMGVSRNESSFLNAVMVGLYEQTGMLELEDEEERVNRVYETRNELAEKHIAPLCKQSCYDISLEQIITNILTLQSYFDPKLYTQLLEEYFNCNIFLFNKDRMFLPRFTQSYYKNFRNSTCIFIYEHWGSEADSAKYPQCELIVKWRTDTKSDTRFYFEKSEKIGKNISKMFRLMNESYALNQKIPEIIFPIPDHVKLLSQTIDTYGKTRCIKLTYKGEEITLLTDPIPPLAIPVENIQLRYSEMKIVELFVKELSIEKTSQVLENVNEPTMIQLNGIVGNVNVSIPVDHGPVLSNLNTKFEVNFTNKKESRLQLFNNNKKIARYLTEYVFWLFSHYIQDNNIEQITDRVLAKFAANSFEIVADYKYNNIGNIFSMNNNVVKNKKLIVRSEEAIKRLMYLLKLYSIRDIKTLRNFHARKSILQYYDDITDFDTYPGQVLLQGEDSIEKWIQETRMSTKLYKEINIGQITPYFFKNELIDDKIFLAQNSTSIDMALSIAINWQRNGYNGGILTELYPKARKYEFTLYIYKNKDDISQKQVIGKHTDQTIRVVGYKLSGMPYFTTLLEID